mmetsp:Transcript_69197/g.109219  ORF Transcript_69197/g.109219 Transcript_69197/m.109219 type:complete len:96 (+) Transcript_69197:837-1124(+)
MWNTLEVTGTTSTRHLPPISRPTTIGLWEGVEDGHVTDQSKAFWLGSSLMMAGSKLVLSWCIAVHAVPAGGGGGHEVSPLTGRKVLNPSQSLRGG